jgi:peptidoglycan/LPS O-acetylase OafA/YrhL
MFGTYRTLLALMVVALHLGGIPNIGAYAVFGFYCLSGYLMTLIMQTVYGYGAGGITRYALNRFLRIYPMYWLSILFSAALIRGLGKEFTASYFHTIYPPTDFSGLARNLMIFFPLRESPCLTPPAWALTVELFFYLLIGLGLSKNRRITLTWFALGALYHAGAVMLHLGWEHRYFTVFAASLPFSTGALIYHYRAPLAQALRGLSGRAHDHLPYLVMSAMLFNWWLGHGTWQAKGIFFYVNYLLCALMVAVLSNRSAIPYINKKLDQWLGDFSYPIYLLHFQVGLVVILVFSAWGIELRRPDSLLMLASLPMMFLCSWLMIRTIEKPIEAIRSKVKCRCPRVPNWQTSR